MANKSGIEDYLFSTTWVHVFEQDTAHTAVFRPEEGDIPLSRRPRRRIALRRDGTARLLIQGPDDRPVEHPALWTIEDEGIVVRATAGLPEFLIVDRTPERLLVDTR